jgi:hypothetical protein
MEISMPKKLSAEKKEMKSAEREGDRKRYDGLLKRIRAGSATDQERDTARTLATKLARK